jgi:hypothetical protein
LDQLRNFAVGVVEVSEEAGASRAYFDALGGEVAYVDPLEAERAFFRDANGSYGNRGVPDLEL